MARTLINVPPKAKRGDVIEIKTLTSHIMETGFRRTAAGDLIPRDIITSFTCRYNGTEVFRADLFPATAANPFLSFFTIAKESGKFEFEWIGDNGFSTTASASITRPRVIQVSPRSINVSASRSLYFGLGDCSVRFRRIDRASA